MRLGAGSARSSFAPSLVMPYPALEKAGLRLRPGQTSLTVAAPGVGKSQLWANLAYRMRVPTLYWSADTDQHDITVRTLALQIGLTIEEVEQKLGEEWFRAWMFEQVAGRIDHIDWVFDTPITAHVLGERCNAFALKHGDYPRLVVLDNMSNAITNPADEYAEIRAVQTAAQGLAREMHANIAILHHAKGEYDNGTKPIPQSGGLQNPFKIPEIGLTLYMNGANLGVCVVKNRGGKSDPAARHPVFLATDYSRARVLGYREDTP